MGAFKYVLVAVGILGVPFVLWLNVTLAFMFGTWVDDTWGSTDYNSGGPLLGTFAFLVLTVAEIAAFAVPLMLWDEVEN